jgi:hypothetical protein
MLAAENVHLSPAESAWCSDLHFPTGVFALMCAAVNNVDWCSSNKAATSSVSLAFLVAGTGLLAFLMTRQVAGSASMADVISERAPAP